jgi:hypothetical protein
VIRAEVEAGGSVRVIGLPRGSVAYIDREWLRSTSAEIPALIAAADGALAWCDGPAVQMEDGFDSDAGAILAFLAVARAAVAAVEGVAFHSVEVTGSGLTAHQVRALLGNGSPASSEHARFARPSAIVETTGAAPVIIEATKRLADLGTLVLVGESPTYELEMNLYPDVHVRGLTLVGVPPPLQAGDVQSPAETGDPIVESSRRLLVTVSAGASLPHDAAWYRVSG